MNFFDPRALWVSSPLTRVNFQKIGKITCWLTPSRNPLVQRAAKGGGKLRGRGTYRKPFPQKRLWTPPPTIFPPPPFGQLSVISLKGKRHQPDQPQFLRPPKVVLESTLCSTFPPPPPTSRDTFPPPLSRCPTCRVI